MSDFRKSLDAYEMRECNYPKIYYCGGCEIMVCDYHHDDHLGHFNKVRLNE